MKESLMPQIVSDQDREAIQGVHNTIDSFNTSLDTVGNIANAYFEAQKYKAQAKAIESMSKVEMQRIASKFLSLQNVTEKEFSQRGNSLHEMYETLRWAREHNDTETIAMALQSISDVVTKSPLSKISEFSKSWDRAIDNDDALPI